MILFENPLIVIFALLAMQLIVVGFLLIRKRRRRKKAAMRQEQYDQAIPLYLDYILENNDVAFNHILERKDSPEVIERLVFHLHRTIIGKRENKNLTKIAESLLIDTYRKEIHHRNWGRRMNAYVAIEQFHLHSFKQELWNILLKKKTLDEEMIQLLRTLAGLGDQQIFLHTVKYLDIPERVYDRILQYFGASIIPYILMLLESYNNQYLREALIRRIATEHNHRYFPLIKNFLKDPNLQTRLSTLRAIKQTRSFIHQIDLMPFLQSSHWQERMIATRICSINKGNEYKKLLLELMGDPVWWMRYRAAEALSEYADGYIILAYIAKEHNDRYARHMAIQWIGGAA